MAMMSPFQHPARTSSVKRRRCPECREEQIDAIEVVEARKTYQRTQAGIEGVDIDYGCVLRVEGHCLRCHYRWTMRGVESAQDALQPNEDK